MSRRKWAERQRPAFLKVLVALLVLAAPAQARVRLPRLVGHHMVLQRDAPVPLWGWAAPGEKVRVTFQEKTYLANTGGADGKWTLTLPAMPAGGPYKLKVQGRNKIVLRDVMLGDVWLASGQSNMEWPVRDADNAAAEIAAATHPSIRRIDVPNAATLAPQANFGGDGWQRCSPGTVGDFSAVAYFFARALQQHDPRVAIGLITAEWGGTVAEAWTSAAGLRPLPDFADRVAALVAQPDTALQNLPPDRLAAVPTTLYNGMIAPLAPYALKGVIWYQGESNAGRAEQYRTLFPALIRDWRAQWQRPELPFLWVQLAGYQPNDSQPAESASAELREAQHRALALPATGMAVALDMGDSTDIHPRNKQVVGQRLARQARRVAYGDPQAVASGPELAAVAVEGSTVRLTFANQGHGLVLRDASGLYLKGFALAGADRQFVWAQGEVQGNALVLHSPTVPVPVAVRYAWGNTPFVNLYNQEGLPAPPFRTDNWPGVTAGQK